MGELKTCLVSSAHRYWNLGQVTEYPAYNERSKLGFLFLLNLEISFLIWADPLLSAFFFLSPLIKMKVHCIHSLSKLSGNLLVLQSRDSFENSPRPLLDP